MANAERLIIFRSNDSAVFFCGLKFRPFFFPLSLFFCSFSRRRINEPFFYKICNLLFLGYLVIRTDDKIPVTAVIRIGCEYSLCGCPAASEKIENSNIFAAYFYAPANQIHRFWVIKYILIAYYALKFFTPCAIFRQIIPKRINPLTLTLTFVPICFF